MKGDNHMNGHFTFEEYKSVLANTRSERIRERLLAQAEADGFDAWELAELAAWADAGV
jgi:hypothetical protein